MYFTLNNRSTKKLLWELVRMTFVSHEQVFFIIILHLVKYFIVIAKTKGKTQVIHLKFCFSS